MRPEQRVEDMATAGRPGRRELVAYEYASDSWGDDCSDSGGVGGELVLPE
ncbi:hypothetical protein ACFU98_30960 [Streptomyces sp. NPDC057575]